MWTGDNVISFDSTAIQLTCYFYVALWGAYDTKIPMDALQYFYNCNNFM